MKKQYLKQLRRKLFFKYVLIVFGLALGGFSILYLFDKVLNGVVIDFIRIFMEDGDPFLMFRQIYAVFLPVVIGFTGFILIYFLCRDLVNYMRILMSGIDDVMNKERMKIKFPDEMKQAEELVLSIANDYQVYQKAAEEDEEKKKDLIYLLAQDIKMPLANILMYLEFLQKEKRISPEIKKDYILQVLYKSMNLEDMINEFFDITRFNLQYAKWNPERMYLDRMLEQVVDEYYSAMEEKNMSVSMEYGTQLWMYADSAKIARVMEDLLRNLIELGEEGSKIRIRIDDEKDVYHIDMNVKSEHLSAYQIAHIFHNFYRLEDMHGNHKAHVLGLGIAKQIVDMQKGSLRASSIGDLFTFYISLPKQRK